MHICSFPRLEVGSFFHQKFAIGIQIVDNAILFSCPQLWCSNSQSLSGFRLADLSKSLQPARQKKRQLFTSLLRLYWKVIQWNLGQEAFDHGRQRCYFGAFCRLFFYRQARHMPNTRSKEWWSTVEPKKMLIYCLHTYVTIEVSSRPF